MKRKARPLGNQTDKAWLDGWDNGITGATAGSNPYCRRPQREAWERGRLAGLRSGSADVHAMLARLRNRAAP